MAAFRLRSEARSVPLTYSEARLLERLFRAPDVLVSRETLAPLLLNGTGNEHALTAAMSRVRRVLRALGYDGHLRSVRGRGYVLKEPVAPSPSVRGRDRPHEDHACPM